MNIHKGARTTPQSRALIVRRVLIEPWPVAEVAESFALVNITPALGRPFTWRWKRPDTD
jgi:leucine-zipper of insertion element IS481